MKQFIWHDGNFKTADTALLTAHDRLRLGEAVFNTILSIDGRLQHGAQHFDNLIKNSCFLFGDWPAPSTDYLLSQAQQLLRKNNMTSGRHALNCTITGGVAGGGLMPPAERLPQLIMRAGPYHYDYSQDIHAIIATGTCRNEGSPLSQIKGAFYGDNILALREAHHVGAQEALLRNNAGHIVCATTSNIVIIKDGHFITPPLSDGAQNGVARRHLLARFDVIERSLSADDLLCSDGIYLINSVRGAVALTSLNQKELPKPTISLDSDFHLR